MEQHKNNRIIRPTDDYHGPFGLKVTPIDQFLWSARLEAVVVVEYCG